MQNRLSLFPAAEHALLVPRGNARGKLKWCSRLLKNTFTTFIQQTFPHHNNGNNERREIFCRHEPRVVETVYTHLSWKKGFLMSHSYRKCRKSKYQTHHLIRKSEISQYTRLAADHRARKISHFGSALVGENKQCKQATSTVMNRERAGACYSASTYIFTAVYDAGWEGLNVNLASKHNQTLTSSSLIYRENIRRLRCLNLLLKHHFRAKH